MPCHEEKEKKTRGEGGGRVWPNLYNNTQRAAKEKLQTTLTHKHKKTLKKHNKERKLYYNFLSLLCLKQTLLYIAGQSQFVVLL